MNWNFFRSISGCSVLLAFFIILWHIFNITYWNKPNRIISWDVNSYYAYLPALFIEKDLSFDFVDYDNAYHKEHYWVFETPAGKKTLKTSTGMAYLYLPFFLAGHAAAVLGDYPANGFSKPYKFALQFTGVLFALLGVLLLRKLLLRYFKDWIVGLVLLILLLSTNLIAYIAMQPPMPHAANFMLFTLLIYLVIRWYEKGQTARDSLLLGFLLGFIVLIRPVNIITVLFFLLWGVSSLPELKNRPIFLLKNYKKILLMLAACMIPWIPQLIYWKWVSGQFFFFSYGEERFYFNDPEFIKVLFGFRTGWLIYVPVMWFALAGFPMMLRSGIRSFFWPVTAFTVINLYLIASWWCWWWGGSFSLRPMTDSYPMLAFPLALCVKFISEIKRVKLLKYALMVLLIASSLLGSFHYIQYYYNTIHYDSMTREAYFYQFLKVHKGEKFYDLLEKPDYDKALRNQDT